MGIIRLLFQFLVGWRTNRGQPAGYFRALHDSFRISLFFAYFKLEEDVQNLLRIALRQINPSLSCRLSKKSFAAAIKVDREQQRVKVKKIISFLWFFELFSESLMFVTFELFF